MEVKIIDRISIGTVHLIYKGDVIWKNQNLLKFPDKDELEAIIIDEYLENKAAYAFFPLSIKEAYIIKINERRIGKRFDHGEGKRGLAFPDHACSIFTSMDEAKKVKSELIAYFKDLAAKSIYGERTKQAGKIRTNFHLFE